MKIITGNKIWLIICLGVLVMLLYMLCIIVEDRILWYYRTQVTLNSHYEGVFYTNKSIAFADRSNLNILTGNDIVVDIKCRESKPTISEYTEVHLVFQMKKIIPVGQELTSKQWILNSYFNEGGLSYFYEGRIISGRLFISKLDSEIMEGKFSFIAIGKEKDEVVLSSVLKEGTFTARIVK